MPPDGTQDQLAQIGSLWIDGPLSWLEIASIRSFVELGHDFVLYTYGHVPNLPDGAVLRDAREIWPNDDIIVHAKAKSPAIHADVFRAVMVRDTPRVWVDTDVIAMQPFRAGMTWFLGHERDDKLLLGNAVMGFPPESRTKDLLAEFLTSDYPIPPWLPGHRRGRMQAERDRGGDMDLGTLPWGTTGPRALTHFAQETGEIIYAQPSDVFFPISFQKRKLLIENVNHARARELIEDGGALAVHLYSRWMRKHTRKARGGVPPRKSWIGHYLERKGFVDYDAIEAEATRTVARKRAGPLEKLDRIDETTFFADLARRQENLPIPANTSRHGNVVLTTMAKDEGPYLLEWVAYHHLLGFTDILFLTNDCSDGTDEMLDALAGLGLLSRLDNGAWRDKPPQPRGIARIGNHPLFARADWHLLIDLDEFLQIRTGDGSVDSLIDVIKTNGATAMPVTWRFFGSNGQARYRDDFVTTRFTAAADDDFAKGYGVKTLYTHQPWMKLAIHRPHLKPKYLKTDEKQLRWVNGSGEVLNGRRIAWKQKMDEAGYGLAQLNHYGVKSGEEFLMRRLRGDILNNHGKYDDAYFRTYDQNSLRDEGAAEMAGRVRALCAALMEQPAVRAAQDLITVRHAERLARLRASEGYARQIEALGFRL
ncbi:MAG: glycosyltransferase family 2 protein [Paracoccus sp. (in: a-proteobacteria)]|mgnify:FL=1|uniref:glycosyltransferase family 2 protein n=1 Tax=unclassified Paracoccus (in: a-proteobacteria) TaxID=2688777 RepID=UPI000C50F622|nr:MULTISPECIES: glycosyltransferase family 2 protein [unclassified Paracoccus (in: a-proteobacteria)]MBA47868.1 hypothetical protein [Paracoccus sp. (in: a-proteobacteria)]|tara:strand:+ start:2715 stop:4664 length:1950 start_codon:yes stop_codon:yes gene_type:complete